MVMVMAVVVVLLLLLLGMVLPSLPRCYTQQQFGFATQFSNTGASSAGFATRKFSGACLRAASQLVLRD